MGVSRLLTGAGMLVGAGAVGCVALVTGRLSLDLGVGRRNRPLGPLVVDIAAPRGVVYAAATAPYAERRPRAMAEKVQILERGGGMVLAAHRTPLCGGLIAVTIETVTFTPHERVSFRLVRGPVPYLAETFELDEIPSGTRLRYTGELGTDFGALGLRWGDVVARSWVHAVRQALETIRAESERRSADNPASRR